MGIGSYRNLARILILCEVIQAGGLYPGSGLHAARAADSQVDSEEIAPEPVPVGPRKPTPPSAIPQPKPADIFRCERRFTYNGKLLDCDSNVGRDAERLRPLLSDLPVALADMDTYQRNRQRIRNVAYVGSIGLSGAIGGYLVSRSMTDSNGNLSGSGTELRNYALIGGIGLAVISFLIGMHDLSKNEMYVEDAVQLHNQAHPNAPIGLIDF